MIVWQILFILLLIQLPGLCNGSHFRGGIVSWRATNTSASGTIAEILIHQRFSWRRSFWNSSSSMCNDTTIANQVVIGAGTGNLNCYGTCSLYTSISSDVACTDYSSGTDFSSGERFDKRNLTIGQSYIIGFNGNAWFQLAIGGNGIWQVTGRIDLTIRADGKLNTSPVTSTLPIIYKQVGIQHVHIIQMADADSTDTLRCRWATKNTGGNLNTNGYDECGSVCAPSLPTGYTLFADNCTLVFTLINTTYYGVTLQIEDFYTSTSPTPMSSVPIQFLFYGRPPPGGNCSTPPTIIGVRPNLACIGTPIGLLTNETVIAQIGCPGKTIIDFTTSSPVGLTKSAILNPSPGIYMIILLWVPIADQYGPQGFCAGAVDSTNVQSDPWCITFLVGFTSPNLQTPLLVQGSASPVGTIFSNQTIFSIQSVNGVAVNRPSRNGTYIYFNDATSNTVVLQYDCGWSPNVIYSADTVIIYAPYSWIPGHTYYVTFDSGVSSGDDFCHAESSPITSSSFWVFDIWNPSLSSTTTTTTTPPTTHTVTTRAIGTTTPMPNLTTTGVIITPAITFTTTTETTTSVTTDTTTSFSNQIGNSTTEMNIVTSEDFVTACQQPVGIVTASLMSIMLVIKTISMYAFFTKMDKIFNPHRIKLNQRRREFVKRRQNHK